MIAAALAAGAVWLPSPFSASQVVADVNPAELWRRGTDSVWAIPCSPARGDYEAGDNCTALQLRRRDEAPRLLGGGYMPAAFGGVSVLWRGELGLYGPAVVLRGDWGGSSGDQDIYSITLRPALTVQKINLATGAPITVTSTSAGPVVNAALAVRESRASNGETVEVPIPLRWTGMVFEVDVASLVSRSFDTEDIGMRETAIQRELNIAAQPDMFDAFKSRQTTVRALLGLMTAGHAREAHDLLLRKWPGAQQGPSAPRDTAEAERFWTEICTIVVHSPLWRPLGLARVPQAEVIEAAARANPGATAP